MKIGVSILVLITLLVSCSPMRKYESINKIHFGSGGGFTGAIVQNTLYRTGSIEHNGNEIGKLVEKETAKLFAYTQKLKSDTINKPGNLYYFIEFYDQNVKYRYVWSSGDSSNQDLNNWYKQLNDLVKKEGE